LSRLLPVSVIENWPHGAAILVLSVMSVIMYPKLYIIAVLMGAVTGTFAVRMPAVRFNISLPL
jgi:hypothetical protein